MIECDCPHEDCGAIFEHYGRADETTCCPDCGRQQMPRPRRPDHTTDQQLPDGVDHPRLDRVYGARGRKDDHT